MNDDFGNKIPLLGGILPPSIKELRENDEARWEASLVDTTCRQLGISTAKRKQMRDWQKRETGIADLTFAAFHQVVPDFPMFFGCRVFTNLAKKVLVSRLFMRFDTTPMYNAFKNLQENLPESAGMLYTGLLFKWPNLQRSGEQPTGLVLHNRPSEMEVSGTRLAWVVNQASNPSAKSSETLRLWVTPLRILLTEIVTEGAWEA